MNNPQREDPRDRDMKAPQHEEYRERDMSAQQQPQRPAHQQERPQDGDMWSGMGEYRQRFDQLQMDFIQQPKETVTKAEALANEAVERMVSTLHDRLNRIRTELGDGQGDTERMRVAMSKYRQLMDSLATPRAA